jgi:hypothetical protein
MIEDNNQEKIEEGMMSGNRADGKGEVGGSGQGGLRPAEWDPMRPMRTNNEQSSTGREQRVRRPIDQINSILGGRGGRERSSIPRSGELDLQKQTSNEQSSTGREERVRRPIDQINSILGGRGGRERSSIPRSGELDLQKQRLEKQAEKIEKIKGNLPNAEISYTGNRWGKHLKYSGDGSAGITKDDAERIIRGAKGKIVVSSEGIYSMLYQNPERRNLSTGNQPRQSSIGFNTDDGTKVNIYHIGQGSV